MEPSYLSHQRIGDFYTDVVLPALADRRDRAFPEFGSKLDSRGWVATNEEMTHRALGVRADRVVAHAPAPRGVSAVNPCRNALEAVNYAARATR
jgi:hypothetical protein